MPEIVQISGIIGSDGRILCGTGFSVKYLSTGAYLVTFDKPFFGENAKISMSFSELGSKSVAKIVEQNFSSFKYFTIQVEETRMYLKDLQVNFTAIGLQATCQN